MKKILAISLSLILLISNIGLTLGTHYCGGMAVKSELMLGHNYLDCGMSDMEVVTKRISDKDLHFEVEGCCENDYQTLEVNDDYRSGLSQQLINLDFAIALVYTTLNYGLFPEIEKPKYAHYSPPYLFWDIPVLNQVFII